MTWWLSAVVICMCCVARIESQSGQQAQHDVIFLIDASETLGEGNFRTMLRQIMTSYIESWPVDDQMVKISVIVFSTTLYEIPMTGNLTLLEERILGAPYEGQYANTDLAFERARQVLNESRSPSRQQHVILVTNGVARYPKEARKVTDRLHSEGVDVWTVGIGSRISMLELLSYTRNVSHVVTTPSFDVLPSLKIGISGSLKDVIILVDSSRSIGEESYRRLLNSVLQTYIEPWMAADKLLDVGVITFSNTPEGINLTRNVTSLRERVPVASYGGRGTNTHLAFDMARSMLQASRVPGKQQTVLVITDGVSRLPYESRKSAELLRADNVTIWAVGSGVNIRVTELVWFTGSETRVRISTSLDNLPFVQI
ncbi:collagen alpha-5(VI) chain-like [Physella acuta]|uniref:collagen alpha-5(VI) chain-like n=1 Tax=Physella acuta TaxID=109671 RepID=UPI0027DAE5D8|nr:collagen alpha-5(VI) chain-like [Physella acuta]XP_059157689.1 collagen alpha-5(VI) chain-like [Physella acuta]